MGRLVDLPGTEAAGYWILTPVEAIVGSGPEDTLVVHHQTIDDIVAQAAGIGGIMPESGKLPQSRIIPLQSAAIRAKPQVAGAILNDRCRVGDVRRIGPRLQTLLMLPFQL